MDQFVGEIRMFCGNFAPAGWALCNGQLMSIAQNTALFSLLGTNYGGDGKSNFGLPNLQAAVPIGAGQGPGLSSYIVGETGGASAVTLTPQQIPPHSHPVNCVASPGTQPSPVNGIFAEAGASRGLKAYNQNPGAGATMSPQAIATAGGSQPHNNLSPYLVVNFIIALQGIFPPRS